MKQFFSKLWAKIVAHKVVSIVVASVLVVGIACAVVLPITLKKHVHTYSTEWTAIDDDYHWHKATCGHNDEGKDKTPHAWDSGVTTAATCNAEGSIVYTCKDCGRTKTTVIQKTNHVWNEGTIEKVSTCSEEGSKLFTCTICGETKSEAIPKIAHDFKGSDVAATCVSQGYHLEKCSVCGEEAKTDFVSALGHTWVDATCTTAAYCSVCQENGSPALGHTWELSEDESVEATCYANGKDVSKCTVCGAEHTDVLPKTAHDYGDWTESSRNVVGENGVCYEIVYTHNCLNEGCTESENKTEKIEEHNFSKEITTAATCQQAGSITYTCNQCRFVKTEAYTDATAHNYVVNADGSKNECACGAVQLIASGENADVNAADLKEAGSVKLDNASISLSDEAKGVLEGKDSVNVGAAALSGNDLDEALAALGTGYSGSQPTVYNFTMVSGGTPITEFGGKVTVRIPYTLSEGEDPNEIIVAYINGDNVEEVLARYDNGYAVFETTHFSYYTVTRMTPEQRCAKFGHVERTVTQEPNCTTPGYTISICVRCGETTKNEKKEALGHDYEITEVAATCTVNGKKTYKCKRCEDEFNMTLFAEGHDWTETAKVEATCKNSGYASYKCEKCSAEYTVTEPQKDHALKSNVVAPTCVERGYTEIECVTCDFKTVTDYVDALGHDEKTKVIDPTCTANGYTLTYCDRCGKEIKRTNEVAAKGHTMVNGVCTVCGEGCDHNYVKGNVVEATCTTNGYTVYTCSKCNTSYNGDEVKALGHKFNVEKCERCGIANPELTEYYLNMLRSVKDVMRFGVKLEGFKVDMSSGFEIVRKDNGEVVYKKSVDTPDFLKQVGVVELALSIAENGEISGYGSLAMTQDGDEMTAKAVIKDGFVYLFADGIDDVEENRTIIGRVSLESLLSEMSDGMRLPIELSYDMMKSAIVWVNTDLNGVLENLLTSNKAVISTAMANLIPYAFERKESDEGYTYTLDITKFKTAVDEFTADDLTISKAIDKIAGEGFFDNVALFAPVILEKKPAEAIELIKRFGIDRKQICSAVDSIYLLVTGERMDSSAYLDQALEQFKDMTVAEVIAAATEGTPEAVKEMVSTYTKMMKETSVIDLILSADKNAERDDDGNVTPEYKKAVIDNAKKAVDGLAKTMESAKISFSTDKNGYVKNIAVELTDLTIDGKTMGGSSSDVSKPDSSENDEDNEIAEPITDRKNTEKTTINGKLTIELGITYDDSAYASLIEQINGAIPSFGNNNVVTLNDNDSKSDADDRGVINRENKNKTLIYIDANGKITKMTTEGKYIERNYAPYYGNGNRRYVYYVENETTYSIVYNTSSDAVIVYPESACGDWKRYSVEGEYTVKGSVKRTLLKYKMADDGTWSLESSKVLSNRKYLENEWQYRSYIPSVFYFDSVNQTFSLYGGHDYETDETRSENKCGGKIVKVCKNCGDVKTYEVGHVSYDYEKEYKPLLEGDEYSCLDGVRVINRCPVCKGVVSEYIEYSHPHDSDYDHHYDYGKELDDWTGNKNTHYEYSLNGKTCEDGITRKEICDICGKTVDVDRDYREDHILAVETEKYSLSEYGSKCGGYFAVYSCLCGERVERDFVRDDSRYMCDFDREEVECWITDESVKNKIVSGYQYDGIFGDVSFYNSYYVMTCSVTDSTVPGHEGPCGFKVRIANYWLRTGACEVKCYYVVQLGYNEADGTCQKELKYLDGEAVCHSLKTLTDDESEAGYVWICSSCGSYKKYGDGTTTWEDKVTRMKRVDEYTNKTSVDGVETSIYKKTVTYPDNTTEVYTRTEKYNADREQIFYRSEKKYRDGRVEWNQSETNTETYTDTDSFGRAVEATKISKIDSDSNGRYDVIEYAYADYRAVLNLTNGVDYNYEYLRLCYYGYIEEGVLKGSLQPWYWGYSFKNTSVGANYLLYHKTVDGGSFMKYTFVYDEKPCTFTVMVTTEDGETVTYYEYQKSMALTELLNRYDFESYEQAEEQYKERYGVEDPTEEEVFRFFGVDLPLESAVYSLCGPHHFYKLDGERSVAPTCTQYGKAVYVCVVCGDEIIVDADHTNISTWDYRIEPYGHDWLYVSENHHECDRCGLENRNGADGDVIFEDLTEKYGDGSNYVIGFYDNAKKGFTVYVSLIKKKVTDGENDEIVLDYEVSYDYNGKTVLKVDKAAIAAIAAEKGLADGEYDVRVTFVPKNSGKDLDYAITLTDNSIAGVSEDEWRAAFATEKFENYTLKHTIETVVDDESSKSEDNIKFTADGCLKIFAVSDDGNIHAKYYTGDAADEERSTYELFYSALNGKFGVFTYDYSAGVYVTTVDITVNDIGEVNGESVQVSVVMSNTKVMLDADGNVMSIEFDYSYFVDQEAFSSGTMTMELKDYGTTVITDEEKNSSGITGGGIIATPITDEEIEAAQNANA